MTLGIFLAPVYPVRKDNTPDVLHNKAKARQLEKVSTNEE